MAAELQKTTVPTDAAVGEELFDAGGVLRHDEGEFIITYAARDAEHVARERFGAVLDAALFLFGRAHAGEVEARKARGAARTIELFDHEHLGALFGGGDGRDGSGNAGTHDHDVEGFVPVGRRGAGENGGRGGKRGRGREEAASGGRHL